MFLLATCRSPVIYGIDVLNATIIKSPRPIFQHLIYFIQNTGNKSCTLWSRITVLCVWASLLQMACRVEQVFTTPIFFLSLTYFIQNKTWLVLISCTRWLMLTKSSVMVPVLKYMSLTRNKSLWCIFEQLNCFIQTKPVRCISHVLFGIEFSKLVH